jgi:hypothetical protein
MLYRLCVPLQHMRMFASYCVYVKECFGKAPKVASKACLVELNSMIL